MLSSSSSSPAGRPAPVNARQLTRYHPIENQPAPGPHILTLRPASARSLADWMMCSTACPAGRARSGSTLRHRKSEPLRELSTPSQWYTPPPPHRASPRQRKCQCKLGTLVLLPCPVTAAAASGSAPGPRHWWRCTG
ncbi:hypothetical protein B0H10DRAFT_56524 [Mycena sp. CBHHK59/15]|nr:hypothetical protein B0H10DRAFT_56524 [Mycena sp. CBHHK59/15]